MPRQSRYQKADKALRDAIARRELEPLQAAIAAEGYYASDDVLREARRVRDRLREAGAEGEEGDSRSSKYASRGVGTTRPTSGCRSR